MSTLDVDAGPSRVRGTPAIILQIVGAAANYAVFAVLGRTLSPLDFGIASAALAIALIASMVCSLGLASSAIRLVPELQLTSAHGAATAFVVAAASRIVVASAVLFIASPILVPLLIGKSATAALSAMTGALVGSMALATLMREVLKALGHEIKSLLLVLVVQPALAVVAIAVWSGVLPGRLTASESVAAVAASHVASALILCVIAWPSLVPSSHFGSHERGLTWLRGAARTKLRGHGTLAGSLLASTLLGAAIVQFDLVAAPRLLDPEDVGPYAAASRVAAVGTLVMVAVNGVTTPAIARAYQRRDVQAGRLLLFQAMRLVALPSAALLVAGLVAPYQLVNIVGSDLSTATAASVLRILMLGRFVNALTGPVGGALQVSGRHATVTWIHLGVFGAYAFSAVLLARWLGPIGLAAAGAAAMALQHLLLTWRVVAPSPLSWWLKSNGTRQAGSSFPPD